MYNWQEKYKSKLTTARSCGQQGQERPKGLHRFRRGRAAITGQGTGGSRAGAGGYADHPHSHPRGCTLCRPETDGWFSPQCAVYRAERPRCRGRGTCRFHPGFPLRGSTALSPRQDADRRGTDPGNTAGRARLLQLRGQCRCNQGGRRECRLRDRRGQPQYAAHTR